MARRARCGVVSGHRANRRTARDFPPDLAALARETFGRMEARSAGLPAVVEPLVELVANPERARVAAGGLRVLD